MKHLTPIKSKNKSSYQKLFVLIIFFHSVLIQSAEPQSAKRSINIKKIKTENGSIPLCFCAQTLKKICILYVIYTSYIVYKELQKPEQNGFIVWQWFNKSFKYTQQVIIISSALLKGTFLYMASKLVITSTCPSVMKKKLPNHATSTDC